MVMIPVLVFHQQMQRHRAAEQKQAGVKNVRLPAEGNQAVNQPAQKQRQIIQVAHIHHAVEKAFPIRRQISLLIHKQNIPGSAKIVVAPKYLKFMHKQIEQSGRINPLSMMNAIWKHHPVYAASHNVREQAGLNDGMALLAKSFGISPELTHSSENVISIFTAAGTDYLNI